MPRRQQQQQNVRAAAIAGTCIIVLALAHICAVQPTLSVMKWERSLLPLIEDNQIPTDSQKEEEVSQKEVQKERLLTNDLPQWFQDYLEFHRSSTQGGVLKDGVPYLVYDCHGFCAGLGGRIKAMIKTLYVAMCSKRVFLIDSTFPFPLEQYLEPNMMSWNASFPNISTRVPVFTAHRQNTKRLEIPGNTTGFIVDKAFGAKMWDMDFIKYSRCVQRMHKIEENEETLFRWGFHALFRFHPDVVLRSKTLKESAGIKREEPYLGIHIRTGDGPTWNDPLRHASDEAFQKFLNCSQIFGRERGIQAGYIASDSTTAKDYLNNQEPHYTFAHNMEIFHVDRSMSSNWTSKFTSLKMIGKVSDKLAARQGMLDSVAELKVLADATCLVMSRSGFSFVAYFVGDGCGVSIDSCQNAKIRQANHTYAQRAKRDNKLVPTILK